MDALALARRGALVFGRATRTSGGANGDRPCAALVTGHGNLVGAVTGRGFMHGFNDELPDVVCRTTDHVNDQFGVEP